MRCPKCHTRLQRKAARVDRDVAGRRFEVRFTARECGRCGFREDDDEILLLGDLEIAVRLAVEGPVTGAALRHIRHALALRATELADLLLVTAETVSRWENDQRRIDRGAWMTVGSVLLERVDEPPRTLLRLQTLASGIKAGDAVIDLRRHRPGRRISGIVERRGVRHKAT